MRKEAIRLAATGLLLVMGLLLVDAATAADMRHPPAKATPPIAPVASYSWTGCYAGAGGGYGMFNQRTRFFLTSSVGVGPTTDNGGRGWFGTVQVGCDYQVASRFVIGAFADYDVASIKSDLAVQATAWVGREKLKSAWAAGGRVGWLPFERLLAFVSAGYTEARFGQVDFAAIATGLPADFSLTRQTYTGWFVGAGRACSGRPSIVSRTTVQPRCRFLKRRRAAQPRSSSTPACSSKPSGANWSGGSTSAGRWSLGTDSRTASIAAAACHLGPTFRLGRSAPIDVKTDSPLSLPPMIFLN